MIRKSVFVAAGVAALLALTACGKKVEELAPPAPMAAAVEAEKAKAPPVTFAPPAPMATDAPVAAKPTAAPVSTPSK